MKILFTMFHFIVGMLTITAGISCNKKFDIPPLGVDPDIPVNMTIAALKARYEAIGRFQAIDEDRVISGIVTANDKSGNFYKQIIIQDSTGAIPLLLDGNGLHTIYPVGRKVFVRLKGMMLGDYGGTIQLGLDSLRSADGRFLNVGAVPVNLSDAYIVRGSFGNRVQPKIVTVDELRATISNITGPLQSMLVQLDDLQFADADTVKTYGDPLKITSAVNFLVKNCSNKTVTLRNSSYANFAGIKLPGGNGSLVGISSVFNGTLQMSIRDTADVQFTGSRCNSRPLQYKPIAEVLQYAVADSTIPLATALEGVLVSDIKNEAAGNYRFQDSSGGIQIRFANTAAYPPNATVGEKYRVNISGLKISMFNGGLQISGAGPPVKIGTAVIIPRSTTIAAITANLRAWESTVVRLTGVTLSQVSNGPNGTNYIIKDASGEIISFVRAGSGITMPLKADSILGYVSVYQQPGGALTPQITVRTQADIYGGSYFPPSSGGGIELGTVSPVVISFDDTGAGLPKGVKVVANAKADTIGRDAVYTAIPGNNTQWTNATGGFKNFASATGLTKNADAVMQANARNRALGIRQVTATDTDAGFVCIINNTIGKSNLKLDFLLQSLDGISMPGRTTTWVVEYGQGEDPRSFTPIPVTPANLITTQGVFSSIAVHADLPAALNDNISKIWIRIVTHTPSSGTGSRPVTGIDDFKISW